MLYFAVLNILLSLWGVKRAYKTKSLIIFIWLVVFYYSITSLVSLLNNGNMSIDTRTTYALNMTLCISAFLFSDFLFNRNMKKQVDFAQLKSSEMLIKVVEVIFWVSLILTYVELRVQDYETYNSSEGQAGWSQSIFQTTSCITILFLYKKQWWRFIIASLLIVGMIASTGVRSLLYFVLMPTIFFILNKFLYKEDDVLKTFFKLLPVAILVVAAVFVVNMLRFDEVRLPEIELTDISLKVLDLGGYPLQLFNSLFHYLAALPVPVINMLNLFGADLPPLSSFLPPSIPKLNALFLSNEGAHFPATIFHDFYMSFGYYGSIWAFVVFSYIKLLCDFLQRNVASLFAFSSVLGWHLYFLMRGSCDTCSGGVAYSLWLALLLYLVLKASIKPLLK